MNIRVLVVDDEPLARLGITTRLSAYADMLVVGECSSGEEARAKIPQVSPDLIFVDVEMPGISGLDLLRELPREQARCIVFLTAHEEYALDASHVEALDYLLKPIDDVRFAGLYRTCTANVSSSPAGGQLRTALRTSSDHRQTEQWRYDQVFSSAPGNEITFVQVEDVEWIEGLGDYAGLHVGNRTHLIREPLTSLEARLDRRQFVRIHRSTIVQVERTLRVEPLANRDAILTLRDGTTLRVSRTYRSRLQELLH